MEGTRRRGRLRKGWREVERDLQVMGVRRWREVVIDREKLFDMPKPTAGCSANGRKRRRKSCSLAKKLNYCLLLRIASENVLCDRKYRPKVKIVNQEDGKLQTSCSRTLYPRPQEHYPPPPRKIYCKDSTYSIFVDRLQNCSPNQFE
jgi:hypothetical protein